MDGMMENKENGCVMEDSGSVVMTQEAGLGICGRCVHYVGFDELSGRERVCTWKGKNRCVAGKVVKCSGFGGHENGNENLCDAREVRVENKIGLGICEGCMHLLRFEKLSGRKNVCTWNDEYRSIAGEVMKCAEFAALEDGVAVLEDGGAHGGGDENGDNGVSEMSEGERKFFKWSGEEDSKIYERALSDSILNEMRRERDRLSRIIAECERREQDLVVARNARIIWERRLKDCEVGSGVKIWDVEIRTREEVEAVVEMFGRIEGLRMKMKINGGK